MQNEDHDARKTNWLRQYWALLLCVVILAVPPTIAGFLYGTGFGVGEPTVTTTTEKNPKGKVAKIVETNVPVDGKTSWDWLGLLGVPMTLAILGYILQRQEHQRAAEASRIQEEIAAEANAIQRELAEEANKEEALQAYFDRLSTLLIDKNLLAIVLAERRGTVTPEQRELRDASVDIIRARTLSILRRMKDDGQRKASVIRFLLDAGVVSETNLDLSDADLNGADLYGVDLVFARLRKANLHGANLSYSYLMNAKLYEAQLVCANLSYANLRGARLFGANLSHANLIGADLADTDLSNADLNQAIIVGVDLRKSEGLSVSQFLGDKRPLICGVCLPLTFCDPVPDGFEHCRDCEEILKILQNKWKMTQKDAEFIVDWGKKYTPD